MCHFLTDPSVDVQKMAFQLLVQAAKKRTEYLVIEAGVDVDDNFKAELPKELLALIGESVEITQETVRIAFFRISLLTKNAACVWLSTWMDAFVRLLC